MKRISAATVAAATALSLVAAPAIAQEKNDDQSAETTINNVEGDPNIAPPTDGEKTDGEDGEKTGSKDDGSSAGSLSSSGAFVGTMTGIVAALLTTSLIVLSNPSGINKIVDLLNQNFGLGLPHVNLPF